MGNTSGITNEHVGSSLLAKNNWWGAASGPGGVGPGTGDPVSLYVDYDPWLASEAPPCPPIPEPAGLGLIGLALLAVRKKRN